MVLKLLFLFAKGEGARKRGNNKENETQLLLSEILKEKNGIRTVQTPLQAPPVKKCAKNCRSNYPYFYDKNRQSLTFFNAISLLTIEHWDT